MSAQPRQRRGKQDTYHTLSLGVTEETSAAINKIINEVQREYGVQLKFATVCRNLIEEALRARGFLPSEEQ